MLGIGLQIQAITRTLRIYLSSLLRGMITSLKSRGSLVENVYNTTEYLKFLEKNELLDKASIIITPTSVSPGFIHAAKPTPTFGPELAVNGGFDTDSNWNKSTGWTISGGKANFINLDAFSKTLTQYDVFTIGKKYLVSFDIEADNLVGFQTQNGLIIASGATGNVSVIWNAEIEDLTFKRVGASASGYIDNVSIKEVIDVDLNVTRNCPATRTNELGVIETVANNVARIDYTDPLNPSILVEPQSTNLAVNSETYTSWTREFLILTLNTIIAPDGKLTGSTVKATGFNCQLQIAHSGTAGLVYTASLYLKRKTGTGQINLRSVENINTPVLITNEWKRFSITTTSTTTTIRIGIDFETINDEIYIWGAQLEQLPYVTSYIPTLASTVTRLQDVISKTGISNYINSANGVLFAKIKAFTNDLSPKSITLSDGTSSNRVGIFYSSPSNSIYTNYNIAGSASFANNNSSNDITEYVSIALTFKNNLFRVFINGIKVAEQLSGNVGAPNLFNRIALDNGGGLASMYTNLNKLQVLNELSEEELILLTGTQDSTYYDNYFSMSNNLNYTIE
jgi:hypothetical protein